MDAVTEVCVEAMSAQFSRRARPSDGAGQNKGPFVLVINLM
jgi:hypothetical protein